MACGLSTHWVTSKSWFQWDFHLPPLTFSPPASRFLASRIGGQNRPNRFHEPRPRVGDYSTWIDRSHRPSHSCTTTPLGTTFCLSMSFSSSSIQRTKQARIQKTKQAGHQNEGCLTQRLNSDLVECLNRDEWNQQVRDNMRHHRLCIPSNRRRYGSNDSGLSSCSPSFLSPQYLGFNTLAVSVLCFPVCLPCIAVFFLECVWPGS